jgi:hypothetical protein
VVGTMFADRLIENAMKTERFIATAVGLGCPLLLLVCQERKHHCVETGGR